MARWRAPAAVRQPGRTRKERRRTETVAVNGDNAWEEINMPARKGNNDFVPCARRVAGNRLRACLHGFDAAAADRGMLRFLADVLFPMPAAFAFRSQRLAD